MRTIEAITKNTENRFLNHYTVTGKNKVGKPYQYFVASRAKEIDALKCVTHDNTADGVVIYSLYGEQRDRVVLIRQYRVSIHDYIYEFPAGLVDAGEDYHQAAVRELHEETGLTLTPIAVPDCLQRPYYTTVGMTDESCGTVYGYASGEISADYLEESEEIEVVLADRKEVARILREENVAIMCAYHLMHFLADKEPFAFLEAGKETGN